MRRPDRDLPIHVLIGPSPEDAFAEPDEPYFDLYEEIEDAEQQLRDARAQLDEGTAMAVADCLDQVMRDPEGQEAKLLALLELAGLKASGPH